MTERERYWAKVKKAGPDECWLWTASRYSFGYGCFRLSRVKKNCAAHLYSFALYYGGIPDGMHVLHKCDNPPCVNPAHLFPGTDADNATDRTNKGRTKNPSYKGIAHPRNKLSEQDIREIRRLAGEVTQRYLGLYYGVSQAQISHIVTKKLWNHL